MRNFFSELNFQKITPPDHDQAIKIKSNVVIFGKQIIILVGVAKQPHYLHHLTCSTNEE